MHLYTDIAVIKGILKYVCNYLYERPFRYCQLFYFAFDIFDVFQFFLLEYFSTLQEICSITLRFIQSRMFSLLISVLDAQSSYPVFKNMMWLQGFPNSGKRWGNQKFWWGIFLPGGGNLRKSNFDHSNLFQS